MGVVGGRNRRFRLVTGTQNSTYREKYGWQKKWNERKKSTGGRERQIEQKTESESEGERERVRFRCIGMWRTYTAYNNMFLKVG